MARPVFRVTKVIPTKKWKQRGVITTVTENLYWTRALVNHAKTVMTMTRAHPATKRTRILVDGILEQYTDQLHEQTSRSVNHVMVRRGRQKYPVMTVISLIHTIQPINGKRHLLTVTQIRAL